MDIININKKSFISEVQDLIQAWVQDKPETRSVAHLSRSTGVTDSAIRRLLNSNAKINDDSIYRILSFINTSNSYVELSASLKNKPEILKWLKKHYSYLDKIPQLDSYKHSTIADEITLNPISFSIYSLVLSLQKIEASMIKDQYGARGEIELEALIEKGLVTLSQNFLTPTNAFPLKITKAQTVALMPELSRLFYKADHLYNYRSLEVSAVSKEGYHKIMDAYDVFLENIAGIYKTHSGEIPVIVAGFFDTLTTHPYFEGEKNENSN